MNKNIILTLLALLTLTAQTPTRVSHLPPTASVPIPS